MDQDTESGVDRWESLFYHPIPKGFKGWEDKKNKGEKKHTQ